MCEPPILRVYSLLQFHANWVFSFRHYVSVTVRIYWWRFSIIIIDLQILYVVPNADVQNRSDKQKTWKNCMPIKVQKIQINKNICSLSTFPDNDLNVIRILLMFNILACAEILNCANVIYLNKNYRSFVSTSLPKSGNVLYWILISISRSTVIW